MPILASYSGERPTPPAHPMLDMCKPNWVGIQLCWRASCQSAMSCRARGGHAGEAGQESPEPLGSVHFNALYGELRTSNSPVRKVAMARKTHSDSPSRLSIQPEDAAECSAVEVSSRCCISTNAPQA